MFWRMISLIEKIKSYFLFENRKVKFQRSYSFQIWCNNSADFDASNACSEITCRSKIYYVTFESDVEMTENLERMYCNPHAFTDSLG